MLTIHVTAKDIAKAREEIRTAPRSFSCPIAQAIRREQGVEYVNVGMTAVIFGEDRYLLSRRAADFVQLFDGYDVAEPSRFILRKEA